MKYIRLLICAVKILRYDEALTWVSLGDDSARLIAHAAVAAASESAASPGAPCDAHAARGVIDACLISRWPRSRWSIYLPTPLYTPVAACGPYVETVLCVHVQLLLASIDCDVFGLPYYVASLSSRSDVIEITSNEVERTSVVTGFSARFNTHSTDIMLLGHLLFFASGWIFHEVLYFVDLWQSVFLLIITYKVCTS